MSFLAPLFLLGALAVIGPVLFHLIRRTPRERVPFSSLLFLEPTAPRLTQRSRIEHWLLLVLRALALALLALAFARPLWMTAALPPPAAAVGGRTVLLLDASASLRRDGLWESSLAAAREALREAAATQDVAVLTFDRAPRPLLSFDDWRALPAGDRLARTDALLGAVDPGWSGTDLTTALMTAAEMLAEGGPAVQGGRRRIVLVSDLQEGSRLEAIQAYDWPRGVEVVLAPVRARIPGNAGLQLAAGPGAAPPAAAVADPGVRVRVTNAADSTVETFQVGWAVAAGDRLAGSAVDVYVPPGQSRVAVVPWPSGGPAAGQLLLVGDAAVFDNVVAVAPPQAARVVVGYGGVADDELPGGSLFFLRKALPQSRQLTTEVVTFDPAEAVLPERAAAAGFFVVVSPLSEPLAGVLRQRLEAGATVVQVIGGPSAAGTLGALAGGLRVVLEDVRPATYAMFGPIDFRHPVFAPFADPRFSDFTKIRFWKYRRLDPLAWPGSQVLASFDTGDPAWLTTAVGTGRLVVLTSGWGADDSQLAVSSKFPPLLASLLEWSGAAAPVATAFFVDEPVPRRALADADAGPVEVTGPDGGAVVLAEGASVLDGRRAPGLYTARHGASARLIPVNLDPVESRTAPLVAEDFERLGVPMSRPAAAGPGGQVAAETAAAMETENRQKLWRWFVLGALLVLLLETLLAGRTARRPLLFPEAVT